jgi:excinuclease ABC subunit C
MNDFKKIINNLPSTPGVYIFKDSSGNILYVGKATSLKSRVSSYFRCDANLRINANPRIANRPIEMVLEKIDKIEHQTTDSVLEALILESNLIKKLQPKYNVDLKDDKSFAYFVVTKEEFPRIIILRETDLEKYDANPRINANPRIANKRKAQNAKYDISAKGGPASGWQYTKTYGPYISKKQMEIALKIIRRIFPFHSLKQKTEKGCLDFQIGTCPGPYAGNISKVEYLKNIRGIRMILEGRKKSLLKKLEKEMTGYSKDHDFEKAADLRNKIFALQHIHDVALLANGDKPATSNQQLAARIEAYDISNISGQNAVGSMVVFKNHEPDKSQYRKFKIKTVKGSDDVGMMREVLLRRFNNDWPMPDLILLDGGQGHLNMAQGALKSLGLEIPLAAVAKGPERKNQDLNCDANLRINANPRIANVLNDKNLLKQIMDEAHRFAITYHKKVRKRNFI